MIAIAIDDEPLALDVIRTFCGKIDMVQLAGAFTESSAALKFLDAHPVDLLFLDINMPALSGIDFYKRSGKDSMVIFTTAYSEYAVEGFNLNAVDYLLKPFEFARFQKAVEKAADYHGNTQQKESSQYIFVRVDYSLVKIAIANILYIEGVDNYIKIYFEKDRPILVRMSMKAILEKLPAGQFERVHRSFIVAFSKVKSLRNRTIHIADKEIPVGINYASDVQKLFGRL